VALTRPDDYRVTLFRHEPPAAHPLELPPRSAIQWLGALIIGLMFAIFAGVLVAQIGAFRHHGTNGVFGFTAMLFQLFWIIGWSVGVVLLGVLTFVTLVYRDSAYVNARRLFLIAHMGPVRITSEYELSSIRNLRVEPAGNANAFKIRFDHGDGTRSLGNDMSRREAERIVARLVHFAPHITERPVVNRDESASETTPASVTPVLRQPLVIPRRKLLSVSAIALVAANLLPLAGVIFGHWSLGQVMLLFWSESAVIGIYTIIKMILVGRAGAIVAAPFFLAHYGGFMSIHFMFVWGLFLGGFGKGSESGPALAATLEIYRPLWGALVALVASHGISFIVNFLRQPNYGGETISSLMASPYGRIMILHVTLIFGGFATMSLKSTTPALVMLIVLKVGADLWSHTRSIPHPAAPAARHRK
jgi:hypothetical protein